MKCYYPQTYNDNVVSCGRCAACRTNRINGWVARLEKHVKYQSTAHFITLTYNEEPENITVTKNGLLSVDVNHVKQFIHTYKKMHNAKIKRLANINRQFQKQGRPVRPICHTKVTYYCAAEYGSKTNRPHYHIIMFNTFIDLISSAWRYKVKGEWRNRGSIHTGDTDSGSIRYTLKYISKSSRIPLFHGDDRAREFSTMSQGIGKDYLTPAIIKWHRADLLNRYYVPANGGMKIPMPRYYADKIYTQKEKAYIAEHIEETYSINFRNELTKDINILSQFLSARSVQEKKLSNLKSNSL